MRRGRRRGLRRTALVRVAVGAVLAAAPVGAQEDDFLRGNRLYGEGDFRAAAEAYQAVLDAGHAAVEVHYNLGNAHYRAGALGRAVLAYERAARTDPSNADVQANLAFARRSLHDRIEPAPRFWLVVALDLWTNLFSPRLLVLLTGAAYLSAGLAVAATILRRPRRWPGVSKRAAVVATAATVLFAATFVGREARLAGTEVAIVLSPEARVLSAPSEEGGLTIFTLHEGTKVRIDDRAGDWAEIALADGRVGWLRTDAIEVV